MVCAPTRSPHHAREGTEVQGHTRPPDARALQARTIPKPGAAMRTEAHGHTGQPLRGSGAVCGRWQVPFNITNEVSVGRRVCSAISYSEDANVRSLGRPHSRRPLSLPISHGPRSPCPCRPGLGTRTRDSPLSSHIWNYSSRSPTCSPCPPAPPLETTRGLSPVPPTPEGPVLPEGPVARRGLPLLSRTVTHYLPNGCCLICWPLLPHIPITCTMVILGVGYNTRLWPDPHDSWLRVDL